MPNLGGKNQKKKKKTQAEDRECRFKDESEEYAQIIKILGDGRFQCKCADGIERIAHVRGKMRKRIWLANGDIILVSLREFEPEKCDVVEKYKEKEVAKLKNAGEIPDSFVLPTGGEEGEKGTGDGDKKQSLRKRKKGLLDLKLIVKVKRKKKMKKKTKKKKIKKKIRKKKIKKKKKKWKNKWLKKRKRKEKRYCIILY